MEVEIKRWGSSLGVIIPSDIVKSKGLKPKDRISIAFLERRNPADVFGTLHLSMGAQEFKDMVRDDG